MVALLHCSCPETVGPCRLEGCPSDSLELLAFSSAMNLGAQQATSPETPNALLRHLDLERDR